MKGNAMKRAVGETKSKTNAAKKPNEAGTYYPVYLRVDGEVLGLMFTPHQLRVASARWKRNPEDQPSKSWLREVRDLIR